MSTPVDPLPVRSFPLDEWAKILPIASLFVRLAVGLGMLGGGLGGLMSGRPGFGFGGYPTRGAGPLGGLEGIIELIPYLELALGLGLIFGIFTTIAALLSCGLVLLIPTFFCVMMIGSVMMGGGGRGIGYGYSGDPLERNLAPSLFTVGFAVVTTPCFLALILLSPRSINRYSLDALIFPKARPTPRDGDDESRPEVGVQSSAPYPIREVEAHAVPGETSPLR